MVLAARSPLHTFATVAGAALTGVGLIFLLIGLGIRGTSRRFGRRAARAEGKIVCFDTNDPAALRLPGGARVGTWSSFGDTVVYRPTVEFTTADGTPVRATSSFGSNPRRGNVGDTVTVLYDPDNPQRVRVDTAVGRGGCLASAFILFGGALAAAGVALLIAGR